MRRFILASASVFILSTATAVAQSPASVQPWQEAQAVYQPTFAVQREPVAIPTQTQMVTQGEASDNNWGVMQFNFGM